MGRIMFREHRGGFSESMATATACGDMSHAMQMACDCAKKMGMEGRGASINMDQIKPDPRLGGAQSVNICVDGVVVGQVWIETEPVDNCAGV